MEVNLLGTIRVTDAFTLHLIARDAGDLVSITSGIAFLPFPLMHDYAASKAGVHAYMEALRAELAPSRITATELVPLEAATSGQDKVIPHALPLDGFLDEVTELTSAEPTRLEVLVQGVHMHRGRSGMGRTRSLRLGVRLGSRDRAEENRFCKVGM